MGLLLKKGDVLRIIDPCGEQVADLIAFSKNDPEEWLSSGRSIDYANTIYLSTGHTLYSNRSNPMFRILEDMVGRHDFLLTPCSPETFKIIYNNHATMTLPWLNRSRRLRHSPRPKLRHCCGMHTMQFGVRPWWCAARIPTY